MSGLHMEDHGSNESARGEIVHRLMEDIMNFKMANGVWPNPEWVEKRSDVLWTTGFNTHGHNVLDSVTDAKFREKSMEDTKLLIPQMYTDIFPMVDPLAVEREIELELPYPGREITQLVGKVDLISAPNFIIDWKTRKSPINERWVDSDLQATVYTALTGMKKAVVMFVQFIFLKTKDPRIEIVTTSRDERHTRWLLEDHIPQVIASIENDIFPPTPGWWCGNCPVKCGLFPEYEVEVPR